MKPQTRQLRNTSLMMMAMSSVCLLVSFAVDVVLVKYVLVATGVTLGVVSYGFWITYIKRGNAEVEKDE